MRYKYYFKLRNRKVTKSLKDSNLCLYLPELQSDIKMHLVMKLFLHSEFQEKKYYAAKTNRIIPTFKF